MKPLALVVCSVTVTVAPLAGAWIETVPSFCL